MDAVKQLELVLQVERDIQDEEIVGRRQRQPSSVCLRGQKQYVGRWVVAKRAEGSSTDRRRASTSDQQLMGAEIGIQAMPQLVPCPFQCSCKLPRL